VGDKIEGVATLVGRLKRAVLTNVENVFVLAAMVS
jgi:predicted translin family RNA/ssDNA-binding protein